MDVNEQERLSNLTLKTQIKVKEHKTLIAVLHYTITVSCSNNENKS
jgi:hypothetical protein